MTIVRQKFGMPGYSGKIPELVLPASSMQTGTAFEMRIPHVGDIIYHAPPQVTSSMDDDGNERFSVRGTRKQVEAIVRSKQAKAKRQGRRMLNPDGSALTSIEDSIAAAVPEDTTEFKARFTYNEIPVWRGLIKIAFNFAHVILGDQWTFSQQAEPLRNAALGRSDNESVAALVSGIRIEIRDLLLRDERDKPTRHLIAIMPGEQSRIIVSLAGEELLTVAVRIDVTTRQLEDGLMASNRMMVSTLPKGGNPTWGSLADFAARLVADDYHAVHGSEGQP